MTDQQRFKSVHEIQRTADVLVDVTREKRPAAFAEFSAAIMEHYGIAYSANGSVHLFSLELPLEVQRFAAVWLLRILTRARGSLDFEDIERQVATLMERVFETRVYSRIGIDSSDQTYLKINALIDFLQHEIDDVSVLASDIRDLRRIPALRQEMIRKCNDRTTGPLLAPLLSPILMTTNRISGFFDVILEYIENEDADRMHTRTAACVSCDELENDACLYGSDDARDIIGGLAQQLRKSVNRHFASLEASHLPVIEIDPIDKQYPLAEAGTLLSLEIRITNSGTGTARDLRIDTIDTDEGIIALTRYAMIGTLRASESRLFEIKAKVVSDCDVCELLVCLSWLRLGRRENAEAMFIVRAQNELLNWEQISYEDPYSLEPVTSLDDLVGRDAELKELERVVGFKAVGSAFIYGQRRVGKTSLSNVLAMRLSSRMQASWVIVPKDSGDYVAATPERTIENLGVLLVEELRHRLYDVATIPTPDFTGGLAPLSRFIDRVLVASGRRLLILLDEFDELPSQLLQRSDLSKSLFQPLRQISNKANCGIILIGGEGMSQIMNTHGDYLNKFRSVELGYFDVGDKRDDFASLIRTPVKHWLDISDAAVDQLHRFSAGNPYFAKLIANQLFVDLMDIRHSYASETDMANAIQKTVQSIGSNSFTHFWTDGLVDETGNVESIRAIRRQILIALGRSARSSRVVGTELLYEELTRGMGVTISWEVLLDHLGKFVSRGVLLEGKDGGYRARIPLFQSWLEDRGVAQLLGDGRGIGVANAHLQADEDARVKDDEISDLCREFAHFRYRGRAKDAIEVRAWLKQFKGARSQRWMFTLLAAMKVYNEDHLRAKMREAFGILSRDLTESAKPGARARRDILVSTLDESAARGGLSYCRMFASENRIFALMLYRWSVLEAFAPSLIH